MTPDPGVGRPLDKAARVHLLLLLLVLAVAAFVQATTVSRTVVVSPLRADAAEYFSYAFNLREFGVYSISPTWNQPERPPAPRADDLRSPGYPLFLAVLGRPEPSQAYVGRVLWAQAALGVLSVWLTYLVAARISARGPALAVAFVAAITPHLATISTYLLSESLFFFLLMLSVLFLIRAVDSGRRGLFVLAGLALGACTLVRMTTLYLPALLVLATFCLPRLRALRLHALAGGFAFLLVFLPWVVRNQLPHVDNVGSGLMLKTLLHGSYPDFMYAGRPESFAFPYRFDPEAERNSADLPSMLGHIASGFQHEPLRYASWYLIGKPRYFLAWGGVQAIDILIYPVTRSPFYESPLFQGMRRISFLVHWPLLLSGLLGALLVVLRPRRLRLDRSQRIAATIAAAVVLYAMAFHVVAAPIPRYSIPFRALFFSLAVVPWRAAWLGWANRGRDSAAEQIA